jgi:hypothetical protein
MASRMEFNQRKANHMLLLAPEFLLCAALVSSAKDAKFRGSAHAHLSEFLCLERRRIFHQLASVRHEDHLD